jgi:ATPase subunit of ABC transporter with duplicated ATPase domains
MVVQGSTVELATFPQDGNEILDIKNNAIEWLGRFMIEPLTEVELRSYMGKMLFGRDDVFKEISVLSGGEKARLIIAKMMLQQGNVLTLDEPTNHLDLESIEALNFALSLVKNTVIFVSHDHRFVSTLANRIFDVTENGIVDYYGTIDEYEDYRKKQRKNR